MAESKTKSLVSERLIEGKLELKRGQVTAANETLIRNRRVNRVCTLLESVVGTTLGRSVLLCDC